MIHQHSSRSLTTRCKHKGFTLVEILVALLVLVLGFMVTWGISGAGYNFDKRKNVREACTLILENEAEKLSYRPLGGIKDTLAQIQQGFATYTLLRKVYINEQNQDNEQFTSLASPSSGFSELGKKDSLQKTLKLTEINLKVYTGSYTSPYELEELRPHAELSLRKGPETWY